MLKVTDFSGLLAPPQAAFAALVAPIQPWKADPP